LEDSTRTSAETVTESKDRSAISCVGACHVGAVPDTVAKVGVLAQTGDIRVAAAQFTGLGQHVVDA